MPTSMSSPSWSATTCSCRKSRCVATSTIPPRSARRRSGLVTGYVAAARALTEADSPRTGPRERGDRRKAQLVALLVERVMQLIGGNEVVGDSDDPGVPERRRDRGLLASPGTRIVAEAKCSLSSTDDRPGIFREVAGSARGPRARCRLRVGILRRAAVRSRSSASPIRSGRNALAACANVTSSVRSKAGLAVQARVAERARTYAARARPVGAHPTAVVRFENDASEAATVIDVHTPDGVGVLYRITRALTDFNVDIRSAPCRPSATRWSNRVLRRRHARRQDHRRRTRSPRSNGPSFTRSARPRRTSRSRSTLRRGVGDHRSPAESGQVGGATDVEVRTTADSPTRCACRSIAAGPTGRDQR